MSIRDTYKGKSQSSMSKHDIETVLDQNSYQYGYMSRITSVEFILAMMADPFTWDSSIQNFTKHLHLLNARILLPLPVSINFL